MSIYCRAPDRALLCAAGQVLGVRCKAYLPDFALAFEHFCIHTGGRGVLDELQKQLKLSPEAMAPSRAALWRCNPNPNLLCI